MALLLALVVGVVYAGGIYLVLQRNLARLIVGVVLVGHATNLLLLAVGGLTRRRPPIIPAAEQTLAEPFANPLSQALILTAIVIGLALQVFVLVLLRRTMAAMDTPDADAMRTTET